MIKTKKDLEQFACQNWNAINDFLDQYSKDLPLPIYTSVDIRESTINYAPVDNNLYPAGFNNICLFDLNMASERIKDFIEERSKGKKVALIPESHTKNLFYLDNIATLKKTIENGGFEVTLASPDKELFHESKEVSVISKSEEELTIYYKESLEEFDFVVLNNDQSNPLSLKWEAVTPAIEPSPYLGWTTREKNTHFCFYHKVLQDFCQHFDIDPNLMQARYRSIDNIDFSTKEGFEELAKLVKDLQEEIGENKTVFIKASQGTYGMGIMVVNSPEEVLSMNRKKRNKMDIGKNKIKFTSVLIQEGIETAIKYDEMPAEVTIYLIGGKSTGGFMRANPLKGVNANLNAKGMVYQKFCISEIIENSEHKAKEAVYSTIARLSTIATSLEIQKEHKEINGKV